MYAVHPSVAHAQALLRNLEKKTGRNLESWIGLLDTEAPNGAKARRDWLKEKHKLGGITAWLIAERSVGDGFDGTDPTAYLAAAPGYVEVMYRGKEHLRPIHNQIVEMAQAHFPDMRICPAGTIVPLYRNHVFAQIKPATKSRLELGLCLRGFAGTISPKLIDTGGLQKGDRITHRINFAGDDRPDTETLEWLRAAYDLDGAGK